MLLLLSTQVKQWLENVLISQRESTGEWAKVQSPNIIACCPVCARVFLSTLPGAPPPPLPDYPSSHAFFFTSFKDGLKKKKKLGAD